MCSVETGKEKITVIIKREKCDFGSLKRKKGMKERKKKNGMMCEKQKKTEREKERN
jgi:hypothetical protein